MSAQTTPVADPMVQRRRLRVELRRARLGAGLTQRQVANELGWSPSKLLRIEAGQVGVSRTDLRALLDHYGVRDPNTVAEFTRLAEQSRRQPWSEYRDVLRPEFVVYLGYEAAASYLCQFEPLGIPGQLQTPDYARRVIWDLASPGTDEKILERQLEARLKRQALLERHDPPNAHFMLDEAVVRRWVGAEGGNATIMREQLERLKDLNNRPSITIQVLRFSHGLHYGLRGPFVLLEFPDPEDDDLLYIEGIRSSSANRDSADEITFYKNIFWDLEKAATPPGDLATFLDTITAEMPPPR
jgi:transcriptional regulator with XRE-family HTH domain